MRGALITVGIITLIIGLFFGVLTAFANGMSDAPTVDGPKAWPGFALAAFGAAVLIYAIRMP